MARKKTSKSTAKSKAAETKVEAEAEAEAQDITETIVEDVAEAESLTEEAQEEAAEIVAAESEAVDDVALAHVDEAESGSLSSKVLTGLVLLLIGAFLALWGGPKLAPMLPAGMAPVAAFLSPGQDSAAELDLVKAELAEVKASVESSALAEEIAALKTQTNTDMQALADQIAATDGDAIEARLADVETQLGGLSAQMGTLTESLTGVSQQTEGISAESNAQIAAYKAQIEGLKAEISQLSSMQGSLSQKIDNVSVTSERKVAEAEEKVATVEVSKSLADLANALDNGGPFASQLSGLSDAGMDAPAALASVAQGGVATLAELKSDFSGAAHAALKATIRAEGETGLASRFGSFLKSQVTVRSLEPREGNDADAVLSRMQGHLDADQLADAVGEAGVLEGAAKAALADWLAKAEARVAAVSALQDLRTTLGG